MLNRRHLRIKVMQGLYAWFQFAKQDAAAGEKEMIEGLQRIRDLYINIFLLLAEMAALARRTTENRRHRHLGAAEDPNPNTRFVGNRVIARIADSNELVSFPAIRRVAWLEERKLLARLLAGCTGSADFRDYLSAGDTSFAADQAVVSHFVAAVISQQEDVANVFEEQSIFWADDFEFACAAAVQTIRQMREAEESIVLQPLFRDEDDRRFACELFRKTVAGQERYSSLIADKTKNWEADRIALMDMILMQMAVCEIMEFETIPVKVTLNEYIDISKYYSTPRSNIFVNGILDKLLADFREKKMYVKTGRGLIG